MCLLGAAVTEAGSLELFSVQRGVVSQHAAPRLELLCVVLPGCYVASTLHGQLHMRCGGHTVVPFPAAIKFEVQTHVHLL